VRVQFLFLHLTIRGVLSLTSIYRWKRIARRTSHRPGGYSIRPKSLGGRLDASGRTLDKENASSVPIFRPITTNGPQLSSRMALPQHRRTWYLKTAVSLLLRAFCHLLDAGEAERQTVPRQRTPDTHLYSLLQTTVEEPTSTWWPQTGRIAMHGNHSALKRDSMSSCSAWAAQAAQVCGASFMQMQNARCSPQATSGYPGPSLFVLMTGGSLWKPTLPWSCAGDGSGGLVSGWKFWLLWPLGGHTGMKKAH